MTTPFTLEELVLGALLHDVGKMAQRAGAPASRNLDQEYCPNGETHRHVLYTDYFIEHALPLPPELEPKRSALARLASVHHRPDLSVPEEALLQQADWLSSGGDRIKGTAQGSCTTARLESVFSSVCLDSQRKEAGEALRYPLLPLDSFEQNPIFPRAKDEGYSYKALYDGFLAALKDVPLDMGVRHYLHSVVTVLERFTWCIPSSTYHTRADISLYDHSYTTASIFQALLGAASPSGERKLLLFGGDVSGIQKYIFGTEETANKGMSKLLRARSFLIQGLVRSLWLVFLDRVGLTAVAKIVDAGGRFILLLPGTDAVRHEIARLRQESAAFVLKHFQGLLRINLACLEIAPEDLERTRFRERFEQFNDLVEQAKLRPFGELHTQGLSAVLPVDHAAYARYGECISCRMRPAAGKTLDTEGEGQLCEQCYQLITQIGRRLPKARYLIFSAEGKGIPLFGGLRLLLEEEHPVQRAAPALDIVNMRDRKAFSFVPVAGYIPIIQESDLSRWKREGRLRQAESGELFFGEEVCAEGEPKTFAMLAEEARLPVEGGGWRSIACLGACKADVDNLGLLFGIGFGSGRNSVFSISRFAMLSRMLNHFFASHLLQVIQKDFPNIYVLFAGGDDLFVLGPWSDTVRLAQRLQADFAAFSGNHPEVTLSAGLPVSKPRLPMRAFRAMAEEALEQAKNSGKNAASLFGVTETWPRFSQLVEQGDWLESLSLQENITQGLLRRMLGYARDCAALNAGDIPKGLYLSHMYYDMARNCAETMPIADLMRLRAMGQNKEMFPQTTLSTTWALYRTRRSS